MGPAARRLFIGDVIGFDGYTGIMNGAMTADSSNYALLQGSSGDTYLNAASGQGISVRTAHNEEMSIVAGAVLVNNDLKVSGEVGFNGATPAARPDYTTTNVTTDRSYNANATTIDELADILGTLIADLTAIGLLQ